MSLLRWRSGYRSLLTLTLALLLLAGCGSESKTQQTATVSSTPTPIPTSAPAPAIGPGQRLLNTMSQKLDTAKTLHGLFYLTSSGQSAEGTVETELWKISPDKSRSEVHQSTLAQAHAGSAIVTDGQNIWQYDPAKKIVYTGKVTHDATTPDSQARGIANTAGGQSQSLLNIIQSIFDTSSGTLKSGHEQVNGHTVSDVHVIPQADASSSNATNFNYEGEVYIDNVTQLPVKVDLDISGLSKITVDMSQLVLNQPLAEKLFTFTIPAGTAIHPIAELNTTQDTGKLTLTQAQKQAGYHLLSIPGEQGAYVLNGVTALGTPGLQTFALNYMKGNLAFTIAQGKPLANLPSRGEQKQVRGNSATSLSTNGSTLLVWTEHGVGIRISGPITADQATQIAQLLD